MARNRATGEPIDLTLRIKTELDNKNVDATADRVIAKFNEVKPAVERANAMVERFKQSLAKINSGEGLTKTEIRLHKIAQEAQSSAQYILDMNERMNQNLPGASHTALEFANLTKQSEAMNGSIAELKTKVEETRSTLESAEEEAKMYLAGFNTYSENLYKDIVRTNTSIMQLSKELKHTSPDSERYQEITKELALWKLHLADAQAEFAKLKNSAQKYHSDEAQKNVDNLKAKYEELLTVLENLSEISKSENFTPAISMGNAIEKELEKLSKYEAEIKEVELRAKASSKSQTQMGNASAKAHQRGVTYARRHRSALQSLLRVVHKIVDGFKKLHKHTHRAFDSSNNGLKLALRNIMRYGLGVRSLYFLFRRLRTATKDAFGVMAQQWEPVNKQISSMIKSLNAVKGSLATMLQPLLASFSAFFNSMMSILQNIMETIGAFFAALTGQDYILRAHAGDVDWAESLADDLGTAADNAEELNKQLAGFDKINNLTSKDDKNKKDKKDIGVGTVTYEKIPIEQLEIYSWLKEMWDKTDFTELGEYVSDKLADMLESLDWDKIQGYGKRIGKSIATGLNGFFGNKRLAKDVGKAGAEFINTVFDSINSFAENFKWDDLGLFMKTGIQSFLDNARTSDWGFSVGNIVTGLAESIYTLVADPTTWKKLGAKIKEGISGFLTSMSKTRYVKMDEYRDMNGYVQPIYEQLNGWEMSAGALSGFVTGLIDTLIEATSDEENWKKFGEGIGKFIANIKWGEIFRKTANLISNIMNGLREAIASAYDEDPRLFTTAINIIASITIAKIVLQQAASVITGKITEALIAKGVLTAGSSGAAGGVTALGGAYAALAIGVLLAIHEIDVQTEQAVIEKAGKEVSDKINEIPKTVDEALGPTTYTGGTTSPGWGFKIATRLALLFTADKFKDKDTADTSKAIENTLNTATKETDTSVASKTLTDNLKKSINTDLENLTSDPNFISFRNNELLNRVESDGKWIGAGLPEGIKDSKAVEESLNYFNTLPTEVEKSFEINSPSKVFRRIGEFVVRGFLDAFNILPDKWSAIWEKLPSVVKSPINTIIDFLNKMIEGVETAFNSVSKGIGDFTKNIADSKLGQSDLGKFLHIDNLSIGGGTLTLPRIPKLAKGAVIPPNKQFIAMLGDQKQGTNVEAPLSTIEEAVGNALKKYGVSVTFHVEGDPKGMFKVMQDESTKFTRRTGLPSFT